MYLPNKKNNYLKLIIDQFNENNIKTSISPEIINLIILPTEKCNFRCIYCYENFDIGKMKDETIQGIKKFLYSKFYNLEYIHISWFGGEPLLAQEVISDISRFILENQPKYNFKYTSAITTNGYLLEKSVFLDLLKFKINDYQISLDGTEEIHNQTRVLSNGDGTFSKIWNNLLDMRSVPDDFQVTFRIHLTKNNSANILKLIKNIESSFENDFRFKIFLKEIGNYNPSKIIDTLSSDKAIKIKKEILNIIGENRKVPLLKNYICYASKKNSFIIRANGNISKCTIALYDEKNTIGKLNADGTMELDNEKYKKWTKGLQTKDAKYMKCPLKFIN